jgi:hypothetical protein
MGPCIFSLQGGAVEGTNERNGTTVKAWPHGVCIATGIFMGGALQKFGEGIIADYNFPFEDVQGCVIVSVLR